MEERGGLQSMGWVTKSRTRLHNFMNLGTCTKRDLFFALSLCVTFVVAVVFIPVDIAPLLRLPT